MKFQRLLPALLVVIAALAQYALLQMFEAGRRQGLQVVVSALIIAMAAAYGMPRLTASKAWHFATCIFVPTVVATAVLLVSERMSGFVTSALLGTAGLKLATLTVLFTGGWLVGLAAFGGALLAQKQGAGSQPPGG
jgi:hypothetical protein